MRGRYCTDLFFLAHLLIAAFFFSNYFLFGQVFVYSTDIITLNYPLLVLARHNFWQGHLGLWNPYLLAGVSSFSTAYVPILDPANWLLFFVPEKSLFIAATFVHFLKLWLMGVFSYLTFYEELQSRRWAFFASIVYQLCGYTLWALAIFDFSSMLLFMTMACYVIWSMRRRAMHLNYALLTALFTLILSSTHIAHAAYAMLTLGILFLYCQFSQIATAARFRYFVAFALAALTSVTINLGRLLAVFAEIVGPAQARFSFHHDLRDFSFLLLRLFDPEVLGVSFVSSFPIISRLVLQGENMHIGWLMPQYFGVLPALLVVWAILSPQKGKINFWTFYVIITLCLIVFIEPFDTAFRSLSPVYETLLLHILVPIGFCMLAGHAAKSLEDQGSAFEMSDKLFQFLVFSLLSIALYIMVVWIAVVPEKILLIRRCAAVVGAFGGAALLSYWWKPSTLGVMIKALGIATFLVVLSILILYWPPNPTVVSHLKNISASIILLMLAWAYIWIAPSLDGRRRRSFAISALVALVLCSAVSLYPWSGAIAQIPGAIFVAFLAMLGLVRFLVISAVFLTVLILLKKRRLQPAQLFGIFTAVLVFDQLPASKVHSHLSINPFYNASSPYPDAPKKFVNEQKQVIDVDLKNYRVNKPNSLVGGRFYDELYGPNNEVLASDFMMYGIRSYGGYNNVVSERYGNLLDGLLADAARGLREEHGLYARVQSDRLLDLVGARYDYAGSSGDAKIIRERPGALSRFMLFRNFEVISGEQALQRLKSPQFDPQTSVILEREPDFVPSKTAGAERLLAYHERSPDEIELALHSDAPAVLFFNDSYHSAWKASVNGREASVQPADYSFMATTVPAGDSVVIFRFRPRYVVDGERAALAGVFGFLCVTGFLYVNGSRRHQLSEAGARTKLTTVSVRRSLTEYRMTLAALAFLSIVGVLQSSREHRKDVRDAWRVTASSKLAQADQGPEALLTEGGLWHAQSPPRYPEWVQVELDSPKRIRGLSIQAQGESQPGKSGEFHRGPKDFVFQGSNDGVLWTDLLTVRDNTYEYAEQRKSWAFENGLAYRLYRIYITANNGDPRFLTILNIRLD